MPRYPGHIKRQSRAEDVGGSNPSCPFSADFSASFYFFVSPNFFWFEEEGSGLLPSPLFFFCLSFFSHQKTPPFAGSFNGFFVVFSTQSSGRRTIRFRTAGC